MLDWKLIQPGCSARAAVAPTPTVQAHVLHIYVVTTPTWTQQLDDNVFAGPANKQCALLPHIAGLLVKLHCAAFCKPMTHVNDGHALRLSAKRRSSDSPWNGRRHCDIASAPHAH